MKFRDTNETYGAVSKFFHWFIALSVIVMLCAGVSFGYLPKNDFRLFLVTVHKSMGITIALLTFLFLLWRLTNPKPAFPAKMKRWEVIAAESTHDLLYLLLILLPVTGAIKTLARGYPLKLWWVITIKVPLIPQTELLKHLADSLHQIFAWVIAALIVIHVLAGLKHHFINKDNVLKRMLIR
jgi:cytochrome b561